MNADAIDLARRALDQIGGEAIEGAVALLGEGDDAGARLLRG